MLLLEILANVLPIVGVAWLLGYLALSASRSKPVTDPATGARSFTLVRGFKVLGIVGLLAPALGLKVTLDLFRSGSPDTLGFVVLTIFFTAISGCLLAEAFVRRVVVSGEGVTGISPWSGQRTFTWKEIRSIFYSAASRGWFLTGPAGKKIFASDYFGGIGELMAELEERVPEERWESPAS